MTGTPLVVLDACVLVNFSLCDTLLRLAEPPRLFEPKWTGEIIEETTRAFRTKLGWPEPLAAYFESELRTHFSDAWITGYEHLIPQIANDRHVLAAAAHAEAPIIVTLNLRHFRPEHLEPWGVIALHPGRFLAELYRQESALVLAKLEQQARDRNRSLPQLLDILRA
jgi:hypothetical protein